MVHELLFGVVGVTGVFSEKWDMSEEFFRIGGEHVPCTTHQNC